MRQRVPGMGIAAMLRNDDIGGKRHYQGKKQSIHDFIIRIVLGKWLQRDIDGVTTSAILPQFKHIAGSWKEIASGFMKRNGQHTRLIIECTLHAVTMMSIEVDI